MKLPTMKGWIVTAVLAIAYVAYSAPQNLSVLAYKVALIATAAVIAHWLDNSFFEDKSEDVSEIARSVVFLGVVLGFTLGL